MRNAVLFVLVMVGQLWAAPNFFLPTPANPRVGADGVNWENAQNWWVDPPVVPDATQDVFIGWVADAPGVVINSGTNAQIYGFTGVYMYAAGSYDLTIKPGASLTASGPMVLLAQGGGGTKTGVWNVEGTVNVTNSWGLVMVADEPGSNGTLNINGGRLNANAIFGARKAGSTAHINLNAGEVHLHDAGFYFPLILTGNAANAGNSVMNITGGTLYLYGSPLAIIPQVEAYIAAGSLTGYGSSNRVLYDFDGEKLCVWADDRMSLVLPDDQSFAVSPTVSLEWLASGFSHFYAVYFGDDYDAVANADTLSPEYKGTYPDQMKNTFQIGLLQAGKTYYWRVDEFDDLSPTRSSVGAVWSFTVIEDSDVYVAPWGDDTGIGSFDRPFATPGRAKQAVRAVVAAGLTKDIHVFLREGIYYLSEPLFFSPLDSGNNGYQVIWENFSGETPVISGGQKITGWVDQQVGDVWGVYLEDVQSGNWWFRQLWNKDGRCTRSRWPNLGQTLPKVQAVSTDLKTITVNTSIPGTDFASNNTELVFYYQWDIGRAKIIAKTDTSVTTGVVAGCNGAPDLQPRSAALYADKHIIHLENNPAFMDQPGEWSLNPITGILLYKAQPGENPEYSEIIAPRTGKLIVMKGDANNPVKNITFRGIVLRHTKWDLPEFGFGGIQAGHYGPSWPLASQYVLPSAVQLLYADNCRFERCAIEHTGAGAIALGAGCKNNQISASRIYDIGAGGIMVGWRGRDTSDMIPAGDFADWQVQTDIPQHNNITNNLLHKIAQELYGGIGIFDAFSKFTTIANNIIADTSYTGISVGFRWDETPYSQQGAMVKENHVYNVMMLLNDGGGIYTLGDQNGASMIGNYFHDIKAGWSAAWLNNGIFFDLGKGWTISNNVIQNVPYWRDPWRHNLLYAPMVWNANYWDDRFLEHSPDKTRRGTTGTPPQSILDAAGTVAAAATVNIGCSPEYGAAVVSGSCAAWATLHSAHIIESGRNIAGLLSVGANGAISGVIVPDANETAMTVSILIADPDGHLSAVGTSNTLSVLRGDLNCDGTVNLDDISSLASKWLLSNLPPSSVKHLRGDMNSDRTVDIQDLSVVLTHWLD